MDVEVVSLHKNPRFIDQCVDLLNDEWPRSKALRLRTMHQGSLEGLPTSLVMFSKPKEKVIAYCKISGVPYNCHMCFIQSVVVAKNLRGNGLGRVMMQKAEEFVESLGITTVYLTTYDKQGFYEKLGYNLCEPIVLFGGSESLSKIISVNTGLDSNSNLKNSPSLASEENATQGSKAENASGSNLIVHKSTSKPLLGPPPPPPPPPPLPDIITTQSSQGKQPSIVTIQTQVTMKKIIC